jgi:hypothetical protein
MVACESDRGLAEESVGGLSKITLAIRRSVMYVTVGEEMLRKALPFTPLADYANRQLDALYRSANGSCDHKD